MSRFVGQKSTKKRSKIEKIIRQDHSDVYFDNDRLTDQLNVRIDQLKKEKLRNDLQRELEVFKLRKEIEELRHQTTDDEEEIAEHVTPGRPHTTGNYNRRGTPDTNNRGNQRAKSAWAKGTFFTPAVDPRAPSPTWSESSLRNPNTLKKYKTIGAQSFKENNKFPAEWYVRSLPASDAAIYSAKRIVRGKSAPPVFTFLRMLRDKELAREMQHLRKLKEQQEKGKPGVTFKEIITDTTDASQMTLVCEQPVKPIVMSRRKLMEITNVDNITERGPSRNTVRKQNFKLQNQMDTEKIVVRVKDFCHQLVELKKRLEREQVEQEAVKIKELQEKKYLASIDIAKIVAPRKVSKSDSDSDEPWISSLPPRRF